nr:uncharacterized protein LOC117849175 [Setaria viridis]
MDGKGPHRRWCWAQPPLTPGLPPDASGHPEGHPSHTFYKVMKGKSTPLGKIDLPVTFSDRNNFRTENVTFDVAEFNLPYNAILGRLALAKFMAAVHYAYSTLKILGPSGVILVKTNMKRALYCAKKLFEELAMAAPAAADEHPD